MQKWHPAMYRYEVTSIEGMVSQVTLHLRNGYRRFVVGKVPERRTPEEVDAKLLDKYDICISKWARYRRKQLGKANIHYLRFGRQWLLMATKGEHRFYQEERRHLCSAEKIPIRIGGYAIRYGRGADGKFHSLVRIDKPEFGELKAYLLERSTRVGVNQLVNDFWLMPYEPYRPVRRQLFNILAEVNKRRRARGLKTLPPSVIPVQRKIVRPFEPLEDAA